MTSSMFTHRRVDRMGLAVAVLAAVLSLIASLASALDAPAAVTRQRAGASVFQEAGSVMAAGPGLASGPGLVQAVPAPERGLATK